MKCVCDDKGPCLYHKNEIGKSRFSELESRLSQSQKECEEKARLLGMSGSREAALREERDRLKAELEKSREQIDIYKTVCSAHESNRDRWRGIAEKMAYALRDGDQYNKSEALAAFDAADKETK